MTEQNTGKFEAAKKKAWILYSLLAIAIVLILVFVIAQDNEEMFFYALMGSAVFYVFRPTDKFMTQKVANFTGLPAPIIEVKEDKTEEPEAEEEKTDEK